MRYIGGKGQLLDFIGNTIIDNANEVCSILDLFAGSGVVSLYMKQKGYRVYSNDYLYFSYILQRGTIALNKKPPFKNLGLRNPIQYLNNLRIEDTDISIEDCFIYQNYSLHDNCTRKYFQTSNAIKIDIIRLTIEKWYKSNLIDENEYFYLLCCLINAVPYVANITGVYAAFLKHWDKRTYNYLELKEPINEGLVFNNSKRNKAFNLNFNDALKLHCDLTYADPPYNERDYASNYHLLETIAKYDYPEIKGITGMRTNKGAKSRFCSKRTVEQAFTELITQCSSKYLLISYSTEGVYSSDMLADMCRQYAINNSFRLIENDYRRYMNKIPNNTPGLKEQLFFLKLRE